MLTCFSYRQAAWSPDWRWSSQWNSGVSVTSSSTDIAANITSRTSTAAGGTILLNVATIGPNSTVVANVATGSNQTGEFNPVITPAKVVSVNATTSSILNPGGVTTNTTTNSSNWLMAITNAAWTITSLVSTHETFINGSSSASAGTTETHFSRIICPITTTTTNTTTAIQTSALTALSTLVSSSGISSTASTSASTTTGKTSVASTFTTTSVYAMAAVSTTTKTTTYTRWTVTLSVPSITTATTNTTATTATTVNFTGQTTASNTVATPSWWGYSMETGTVLLATGNNGALDLPAWLEMSNFTGQLAAFWNFSTATQTTLWPSQPIGTNTEVTTSIISTSAASITQSWTGSFTAFGTSSFTTTTSISNGPAFFSGGTYDQMTAPIPLSTQAQNVTSYTTFTASIGALILTPINTSTFAGNDSSINFTPVISTFIISNIANEPSVTTTISFTTLQTGYTTALAATGSGISSTQTTTITGSQLSVTSTTGTNQWFVDWSCPTQPGSSTQTTSSSTGSTAAGATTFTRYTTGASGSSRGFTQNVFQAPYWIMQALTSSQSAGAIIPAASAQTWNPSRPMQGFSPWTSTALTFLSISAPAILTELTFLPFASGNFLSIDTISGPISSAQSGLWAFIGNPVTTTASTSTTTTGGGTTSVKLTKISSFTLGASSVGTASTAKLTIAFPTNMDQAAASIGRTVTYTTTAPGTTTTASSTASASGITLTNSITSTFPVSAGYTTQSVRPFTVTTTATFASGTTTQTSITLNSSNNTVTDTQQTADAPRYQFIEGAGPGQAGKGPGTIWLCGAAVLLYLTNSSTSSVAALNLAEVVIGGTFTTTSSTNSAGFPQYTFTGVASWQTSPIFWILTNDNRFNIPLTTATNFWLGLPPVLTPLQATNPAPARTFAGL